MTEPTNGWFNPAFIGSAGISGANSGFMSNYSIAPSTETLMQNSYNLPNTDLGFGLPSGTGVDVPQKSPGWMSMQGAFGGVDADGNRTTGWFNPLAQTAIGGIQAYLGYKNLQLAQKNSEREWQAWGLNYDNQQKMVNEELASRQAFRNSAGGVASGDVSSFMDKYGIADRPKG